jgi:DNA-binding GntR family transcriptional regulator
MEIIVLCQPAAKPANIAKAIIPIADEPGRFGLLHRSVRLADQLYEQIASRSDLFDQSLDARSVIRAGDADAAHVLMRSHIDNAHTRVLGDTNDKKQEIQNV